MKCGQPPKSRFLDNCSEKSYIIPLPHSNSEEKAFEQCSYHFDNTQEIVYQEGKKFCLELGCYAPIAKEIIPPEFDLNAIKKLNEYSFVQKKNRKEREIKKNKNKSGRIMNKKEI